MGRRTFPFNMCAYLGRWIICNARQPFLATAIYLGHGFHKHRVACEAKPMQAPQGHKELAAVLRSSSARPLVTVERRSSFLATGLSSYQEVLLAEDATTVLKNSILLIPDLLSDEECRDLLRAAELHLAVGGASYVNGTFENIRWALKRLVSSKTHSSVEPLARIRLCDMDRRSQELSASIVRARILPFLEQEVPHVARALFGQSSGLQSLNFCWSPNEPAVNQYSVGGEFPVHKDFQDITVNVLLSESQAFSGGGTAFWPEGEDELQGNQILLKPRRGVGVIFNGNVSHAGKAVESGLRHVYVASFSLRPYGKRAANEFGEHSSDLEY